MGKRQDKDVPLAHKQRNRKNKKTKTSLVFDVAARNEWLTGFSRRKNERRKRAQFEEIKRLKEEKRRIKQEKREKRMKEMEDMRAAVGSSERTELEALVEPKVFDMTTHTVTVIDVADTDFIGGSGLHLGFNSILEQDSECVTKANENGSESGDDERVKSPASHSDNPEKPSKTSARLKRKGKTRKNFSHLMDKKQKVKRAKPAQNCLVRRIRRKRR